MTTNDTPGPWTVHGIFAGYARSIRGADGTVVAEGGETEAMSYISISEADARLIATSPEMLDALCLALPYVESALEDAGYKPGAAGRMVKTIRAAIAKATGVTK